MKTEGKIVMRERARSMRQEMTPAELRFWCAVRNDQCDGLRFRRQKISGQYILDFYCASAYLGIEIDGGVHDTQEQLERDESRTESFLEERGIRILRFRNEEIMALSYEKIRQRILEFLSEINNESQENEV
jgi:very-short-patch-repair endonuclease